ncbi:hypothetical protein PRIPAC_89641 [Pristionchus pacificus]|uniref:Uncharacterized protein n=1 Tax=Pristionchus pacificus TaxID=54126 RepID=A0A2A6B3K6_PRIPA|nr:hypothetical protein PRIPAC_89641 [Pristionchus pacificus]|eukprot:PDM60457.1 hypothetical protein PRIPAC_53435 [Pristionchus pacificus]
MAPQRTISKEFIVMYGSLFVIYILSLHFHSLFRRSGSAPTHVNTSVPSAKVGEMSEQAPPSIPPRVHSPSRAVRSHFSLRWIRRLLIATQESIDNLSKLVQELHVKLDKLLANPSSTVSPIHTVSEQSSYASIVRALSQSEKTKDKSQRAVLETAQHDEEVLKEIIDATHDKELKDAYTSGSITHKRFPENKTPGRRIVKYTLPSTSLRDRLLSSIRSIGRPVSFEPSMFLRRDLMPSELN